MPWAARASRQAVSWGEGWATQQEQGDALRRQGVFPGPNGPGGLGLFIGDQGVVQVGQHQPDAPGGQGLWVQGGKTGVDPPGNG